MKIREFLGILGISPMVALLRKIPNVDPEGNKIFEINWKDEEMGIRYYGGVDFGYPPHWAHVGDCVLLSEDGKLITYPYPPHPPDHPRCRCVVGYITNVDKDFVDISLK